MSKLTDKQKVWLEAYLKTWNATEAARIACYKHPNKIGPANLVKIGIREEIDRRISELVISADKVLLRLGQQAEASIAEFLQIDGDNFYLDLEKVKQFGHLVKKIKNTRYGIEIEIHDSQRALELMGKHFALFTERVELSGEVMIKGYLNVSPDDWSDDETDL